jgi:hypothetical protein
VCFGLKEWWVGCLGASVCVSVCESMYDSFSINTMNTKLSCVFEKKNTVILLNTSNIQVLHAYGQIN